MQVRACDLCVCVCVCARAHISVRKCVCVCACVCLCVCACMHMCACIHVYVCMRVCILHKSNKYPGTHRCLHPHYLHRKKQNVSEPNGTKVTFTSRKHKQKSKKLIAWFFVAHNETHTAFNLSLPLLRFQMNFFLHATFSINNLYRATKYHSEIVH